jgi:exodeoxyribonuclease-3
MIHRPQDLQNHDANLNLSGALPEEQQWMDQLFSNLGYADAFREINKDDDEFTWWPEGDRSANGWRIDYQVVSSGLTPTIEYGATYKKQVFSNHAPLIMDFDYEI